MRRKSFSKKIAYRKWILKGYLIDRLNGKDGDETTEALEQFTNLHLHPDDKLLISSRKMMIT